MNKQTKETLALIYFDLDCVSFTHLDDDGKYHLNLALGNLKDIMKKNKIKEHGDTK